MRGGLSPPEVVNSADRGDLLYDTVNTLLILTLQLPLQIRHFQLIPVSKLLSHGSVLSHPPLRMVTAGNCI